MRKADLSKNPLKTIRNMGKVPVVRVSNEGFKNYNQTKFFKSRSVDEKRLKEGCFVCLTGFQENIVAEAHMAEDIHIGYIEPNEMVYVPCVEDNNALIFF